MKKIILILLSLLIFILIIGIASKFVFKEKDTYIEKVNNELSTPVPTENAIENKPETSEQPVEYDPSLFTDLNSILILANKTHPLPEYYEPSDLVTPNVKVNKSGLSLRKEASDAIEEMFNAAKEENINLVLGSSYRSYSYQASLFSRYVAKDGEKKAAKYSSRPGQSEHQTGLAADISDESGENFLKQSFKDTKEGIWLKNNSYKFGYILRYPEGKEDITGYMFEPWHFRYIGKEEALKVYNSGLCFEEFYKILD